MHTKFITFGSHSDYIEAAKRLVQQATALNIFKQTKLFTAEDLKNSPEFWDAHGSFIKKNSRGFGYWLWKPYIIQKNMQYMQNGDILLYLDCGCELSSGKRSELLKCMDVVKTDKIVYTRTGNKEKEWTKMDLLLKLDMNKAEYLNSNQLQAGAILFLVCDETRCLVDEWYKIACNYHNIDDSPSLSKNLDGFKEHRHDQSIFSLLIKKYNLCSKKTTLRNAVHYIRNLSGLSQIYAGMRNLLRI